MWREVDEELVTEMERITRPIVSVSPLGDIRSQAGGCSPFHTARLPRHVGAEMTGIFMQGPQSMVPHASSSSGESTSSTAVDLLF